MRSVIVGLMAVLIVAAQPAHAQGIPGSTHGGTWINAPGMLSPRDGQRTVSLHDGRVLVLGGEAGMNGRPIASAELFNPALQRWSQTGAMTTGRIGETATVLPDGRVLVVGGIGPKFQALHSAEIFDPELGTWHLTAPLPETRFSHAAALLPQGLVLVSGGIVGGVISRSTVIYDPGRDRWERGPDSHCLHAMDSSVTLRDGRVLIAEGYGGRAEIYDPRNRQWTTVGPRADRTEQVMIGLRDGTVLVASGLTRSYRDVRSARRYRPNSRTWTNAGSMHTPRSSATAVLLQDGQVLVIGGQQSRGMTLTSTELYNPARQSWVRAADLRTARAGANATILTDGSVLVCGGTNFDGVLASCEIFHPGQSPQIRLTG